MTEKIKFAYATIYPTAPYGSEQGMNALLNAALNEYEVPEDGIAFKGDLAMKPEQVELLKAYLEKAEVNEYGYVKLDIAFFWARTKNGILNFSGSVQPPYVKPGAEQKQGGLAKKGLTEEEKKTDAF